MCLLLETIKVQNRELQNIHWHNVRLNATRKILFQRVDEWNIAEKISIPADLDTTVYKCRLIYGAEIQSIEFAPYIFPHICSLQIVEANHLDYSFKYADRTALEQLKQTATHADDILMLKNGYFTDTSYCNVAFWDGAHWFTPQKPLLNGVTRQRLIVQKILIEQHITPKDLSQYQKIKLFNAMIDWNEGVEIPIGKIFN